MKVATVINQQIRGYILKVIKLSYPQPVGSNVIDVCLIDAGMPCSMTQLEGHLHYLTDRGYVTIKSNEMKEIGNRILLVNLTSHGIDVLEGTLKDEGVRL